jgi:hypothetical protein
MKTIWQWIKTFFAVCGFARKQITRDEEPMHNETWNPFVAAAVERERKQMILNKLREFFRTKPRSWLSPHARAQAKRRQRRNAAAQIEKRLHSRKGIA